MARFFALAVICFAGIAGAAETEPSQGGPEHEFLKQFAGQWDCEVEVFGVPGQPPAKSKGSMTGTTIGDFWAIVDVQGEAFGQPFHGQATFGYDAREKKKYIGTWADSTSDFLWHYEGRADGNKLVLHSQAPNPADPGKMIKARDTWEFKGPNLIVLTGEMEGPDGNLIPVMRSTCRKK